MSMTFLNYLKKVQLILVLISLLIFANLYRSLSLEVDQSSGSNLCVRMDSEIEEFLLYDENGLHKYLIDKNFNGELNLGYVNNLKSNKFKNIYYISAYMYDSDYYEGTIKTWVVDNLQNPKLIFETNENVFIVGGENSNKIIDYKNDPTYLKSIECSRVEKYLFEQRN